MRRRLPFGLAACSSAVVLLAPLAPSGLSTALAALSGVASLAFFLARLVDRRAALYGALALSTMPLTFAAARLAPRDAWAMAASAAAVAGLGVAVFDGRRNGRRAARTAGLALGAVGLAAGGLSSGALLGVAVPALAIGVAWALLRWSRPAPLDPVADAAGALSLLAGVAAAGLALRHGLSGEHAPFDAVLQRLGHGLFPWSGLFPLAAVALISPPLRGGSTAAQREEAARVVVLAGASVALVACSIAGGRDPAPFTTPAIPAAAIALAARDLDRRAREERHGGLRDATAARTAALAAAILVALLAHDLLDAPERALAGFAPSKPGAPLVPAAAWLGAAAMLAVTVPLLAAFDRPRRAVPWHAPYVAWSRTLASAFGGYLAVGLCFVQAALSSLALTVALRPARAAQLGPLVRTLALHAAWLFPIAVVAVAWLPLAARDALHGLRRCARIPRGGAVVGAFALAGALLTWGFVPALLSHASPAAARSEVGHGR
jgi:hypothetical protein